ncbi:hypothetical protein EJB05_01471, partial [Eragrostis curvula]
AALPPVRLSHNCRRSSSHIHLWNPISASTSLLRIAPYRPAHSHAHLRCLSCLITPHHGGQFLGGRIHDGWIHSRRACSGGALDQALLLKPSTNRTASLKLEQRSEGFACQDLFFVSRAVDLTKCRTEAGYGA